MHVNFTFRVNLSHTWQSLALIAVISGCGSKSIGPDTAVVTGEVTLDGAPMAGADVSFLPVAEDPDMSPAQAVTDEAGKFEVISVFDQGRTTKPGMIPGDYRVEIRLLQPAPAGANPKQAPTNVLPDKYASARTSGLQVKVSLEGENHFPLKLTK
jgi:hypothetical protein